MVNKVMVSWTILEIYYLNKPLFRVFIGRLCSPSGRCCKKWWSNILGKKNKIVGFDMEIRKLLMVDHGLIPGLFNFFINGGIAWWINQSKDEIPLWGQESVAMDFIATAFLLPLITCLIVTPMVAAKIKKGKLLSLQRTQALPSILKPVILRAIIVGLIAAVAVALPIVSLWHFFGPENVSVLSFVWLKGVFAFALGAMFSSLIAWLSIRDNSQIHSSGGFPANHEVIHER